MRLTILGKSPSWQDAGGACSGDLLVDGDTTVLLDCGNGVFAKLRRFVDYLDVDAVVLSHLHADHFLDLVPYSYALTHTPRRPPEGTDPVRPRLIAPPGAGQVFRRVVGAWGNEDLIESAFALEEYEAESIVHVGPLRITFRPVPHFIDTYAVSVESEDGGGRLAYGADSRPTTELVDFARAADLLVIEATLTHPEPVGPRGHMTPEEAGEHARAAGAGRAVITHISDELDQEAARARASEAFGAPVDVASEGASYEI